MADTELNAILDYLDELTDSVATIQTKLTACRAVGPENGGQGESIKADMIEKWLAAMGVSDIVHIDAEDNRVSSGKRPNFIATIPGKSKRALWLFAHMDVVPAGDLTQWKTSPWTVEREGDTLYGRGVEDNQQGLTSMILLAHALNHTQTVPAFTLKLVFMSDEECGNDKGLDYMLKTRPELFPPDDFYIVPDGGTPDGSGIEIAEKGILWLRGTVQGVQCHASTPQKGVNALVAASDIILSLTGLAKDFSKPDPLFDPPRSTFVPTRHAENVAGVNILPGTDTFFLDCRLLPGLTVEEVVAKAEERASTVAKRRGVTVKLEVEHYQPSTITPAASPVVQFLGEALTKAGITPKVMGIGGGTVAALLRRKGIPAAVWSTIQSTCHEPNEHSSIQATIGDAKIFAMVLMHG